MIGDPVKFCTFRIFACTPCKFPFSANARSGLFGVGWGGGVGCNDMHCSCRHVRCYAIVLVHMFDATQLYLRTCSMLRNCICAHVRCYAIVLAHMFDATQWHLRTCLMLRNLQLRTCSMLRNFTCAHVRYYAIIRCYGTFSMLRNCICAHVRCYAINLEVVHGKWEFCAR